MKYLILKNEMVLKKVINHTLKCVLMPTTRNTLLANTRALIALVENNYLEDGSIKIPKVLQPYMGGLEKIEPVEKK